MRLCIASALSTEDGTSNAAQAACAEVSKGLAGQRPDLAVLFLSPHHAESLEEVLSEVHSRLGPQRLIGCMAQGVIGKGREVERTAGFSLWAACLPGVQISIGHVRATMTNEGLAFAGLPEVPDRPACLLLLGEPYTFPTLQFMERLEEDHPRVSVVGGMASGALGPGEKSVFLGREPMQDGAVVALLSGAIRVRPVVSQGCRPFGKHLVITKAENNLILELGGRPALERLDEQISTLSKEERDLLKHGLHLGRAIDPSRQSFNRGDFLIRNVVGIDPKRGAVAITDPVRPGQTVQFHLRDAASATEDLELLLREARGAGGQPAGALLFSCNGRGSYLFSAPDHDAGAVERELGTLPLAGFFAAGELGPVGGRNFLHSFTASLALFEEA
jgi:small ligand-binding sensory domain FIST